MIEMSMKKLENIHEEISEDLAKTEADLSKAQSIYDNIENEVMAKRNMKFAVERLIQIKSEQDKK